MNPSSPNPAPTSKGQQLLQNLLRLGMVDAAALEGLPNLARTTLSRQEQVERLLVQLVDSKLLTPYQADRIRTGKVHGLMLGDYRVRDRLGVGTSGVVFRGEHRHTGAQVAIKVLIPPAGEDPGPMLRFFAERKAVAQLSHPGIVHALDVGETTSDDPDEPVLYYYVMEYVPGVDLEVHVQRHGPMEPVAACAVVRQVADALTEAHRHNLVHRDIKPANILLTPEGRAFLLDFGLVRQFNSQQTAPGALIGLLEWIAPEQLANASNVDIRADIYSLGCTLFWCLTGKSPYGRKGRPLNELTHAPPSARSIRPELREDLAGVVAQMMAPKPDDRPPTPQAVMDVLAFFLSPEAERGDLPALQAAPVPQPAASAGTRILIVDGDAATRTLCREALAAHGHACAESADAKQALESAAATSPELVVLSTELPGMSGLEVLKKLRQNAPGVHQKIIMLTSAGADVRSLLAAGADDYLAKPVTAEQIRARVKTALQIKPPPKVVETPAPAEPQQESAEAPPPQQAAGFWQRARNWLKGGKE